MKIEIDVSEDNESTSYPWWFIVDPRMGIKGDPANIAGCITGPFFSREEAEDQLTRRRYDYGKKAIVWCGSGYRSGQYRRAFDKNKKKARGDGWCHECQLQRGAQVPAHGHSAITVCNGVCSRCGKTAGLVPSSDYDWPKKGKRAIWD